MLPDVGGSEYLLIAAVALIVIGPKDLPKVLRKLGEIVGKMRRMAADFRSSFDDMASHAELDDLRREVEAMKAARPQDATTYMAGFADTPDAEAAPRPAPVTPPARKVRASKKRVSGKSITAKPKAGR